MYKLKFVLMIVAIVMLQNQSRSQHVQITKEQLLALTPEWKGDRFADGRPRVPDNIIQRNESGKCGKKHGP
jgi:hypothetical protein